MDLFRDFSEQSSINFDLIREIVNRCIKVTISECLHISPSQLEVTELRWCPAWTLDKKTKEKKLRMIKLSYGAQKEFHDLDAKQLDKTGLFLSEFFEYLKKSDALRVKISASI